MGKKDCLCNVFFFASSFLFYTSNDIYTGGNVERSVLKMVYYSYRNVIVFR